MLERRTSNSHRKLRGERTAVVERLHGDSESVALAADPILDRHPHVLEGQRNGVRSALSHLVLVFADGKSLRPALDDQAEQAAVPLRPILCRKESVLLGESAVGD